MILSDKSLVTGTALLSADTTNLTLTVQNLAVSGTLTVTGAATFNGDITFSANTRGKDQAITLAATTLVITGKTYPDASYSAVCTSNYNTTCFVTGKTSTGFTLNFGTVAPASATVDWLVVR